MKWVLHNRSTAIWLESSWVSLDPLRSLLAALRLIFLLLNLRLGLAGYSSASSSNGSILVASSSGTGVGISNGLSGMVAVQSSSLKSLRLISERRKEHISMVVQMLKQCNYYKYIFSTTQGRNVTAQPSITSIHCYCRLNGHKHGRHGWNDASVGVWRFPPILARLFKELVPFCSCLDAGCGDALVLGLFCESELCILLTHQNYMN